MRLARTFIFNTATMFWRHDILPYQPSQPDVLRNEWNNSAASYRYDNSVLPFNPNVSKISCTSAICIMISHVVIQVEKRRYQKRIAYMCRTQPAQATDARFLFVGPPSRSQMVLDTGLRPLGPCPFQCPRHRCLPWIGQSSG